MSSNDDKYMLQKSGDKNSKDKKRKEKNQCLKLKCVYLFIFFIDFHYCHHRQHHCHRRLPSVIVELIRCLID